MHATQPDLWSAPREESKPPAVTQEVKDEKVINGRAWMLVGSDGVAVPTKAKAIALFVKKYGRTPAIIHYQETSKLWFVGPKEEGER
jgi:hypothetical protein